MSTITDLGGTTWLLNSTIYMSTTITYSINFISNNATFSSFILWWWFQPPSQRGPGGEGHTPPEPSGGGENFLKYHLSNPSSELTVCSGDVGVSNASSWMDESYRTISITGGTDATNTNLISWLESNATQIIKSTLPAVSIFKITDSNNNTGYFTTQSYFTSDSTASSSTKTATSPNNVTFSDTSLETGVSVHIHFTYANTASSYTLRVGTSTAKSVSLTSPWEANSIVTFTYDGTNWVQNDVRPVVRLIKVDNTVVTPDSNGLATLTNAINDYIDSQLTPVVTLIEFSIAGTTYQAEDGMTWSEWCSSTYNTGGYAVNGDGVSWQILQMVGTIECAPVSSSAEIIAGFAYVRYNPSACI